jgi:DNA-binding MarR family transcriptional regulator
MQRQFGQNLNFTNIFVADALDELAESGVEQPTVGTIAERLGIEPSRVSRMVTDAVLAGIVKRHASQLDGRRAHLELTKDGRKALATVRRFRIKFFSRIVSDWSDQDCVEFAVLLSRFTNSLKNGAATRDTRVQVKSRRARKEATNKGG